MAGHRLAVRLGVLAALVAALVAGGQPGAAQRLPRPPADSARTLRRRLPDVQVRAVRPEHFAVGSRRLTLDSAALSQFRGGTVAEVLQARTPLYLKNYGPGQLATIALRGTSAQHTAVLWNGLNIMLPTLGQNDFALLPVGANAQLSVQPGPAAALYGSGAIGGAVLLNSAPDWQPGLRGSVQADGGSFGLLGGSLEASGSTGPVAAHVAASYRTAQNNYSYRYQEPRELVRRTLANAALRHQWSLSQDVALRLGAGGELTAAAWLTDTDREIPGAVSAAPASAREQDQSRRLVLGYRHAASARRQWAVRGAWFEDVLDYRENDALDHSRVRTTQAQAEHTAAVGRRSSLRTGLEAQHFAAVVSGYGPGEIAESRAAAFGLFRYEPAPAWRLSANLRQALLPGGAAPLTPTVGAEWDVLRPADTLAPRTGPGQRLTLRASAARGYRAPTLNERFWRPGPQAGGQATGRPDLRPETSQGAEAGLRHRLLLRQHVELLTELTAFVQVVDDWVQWLPDAASIWQPQNLRQVRSRGLETSTLLHWQHRRYALTARAAYGLTQTTKTQGRPTDAQPVGQQLAFVPLHQAAFSLDQQWRGWQLGGTCAVVGYRTTDGSGTEFLPAYTLVGATLGHSWTRNRVKITGLVQVNNLLNEAFYSYPGRPAPPRAGQLSLRVGWR